MRTEGAATSQPGQKPLNIGNQGRVEGIQKVFRNVCCVLLLILVFCVPGFLKFRDHCAAKGYYVFSSDSLSWCGLGFLIVFIVKYGFMSLMRRPIEKVLNPNYNAETREKKIMFMQKLSYDTIFYSTSTAVAYLSFREEYWFPASVGGQGSCSQIYREYPNWPAGKRSQLEIYFCFQLGVHIFSIFDLVATKYNEKKYYEWMLHHFMATSLILFSLMCNEITAGIMVLIIHDASDIFMAGTRCYVETYIPKNKAVTAFLMCMLVFTWVYFRIVVFPFCLLSNVYINKPMPTDEWYIIYWEYLYLLSMAFVLFGMHLYWTYCIIKSLLFSAKEKGEVVNMYDTDNEKKK